MDFRWTDNSNLAIIHLSARNHNFSRSVDFSETLAKLEILTCKNIDTTETVISIFELLQSLAVGTSLSSCVGSALAQLVSQAPSCFPHTVYQKLLRREAEEKLPVAAQTVAVWSQRVYKRGLKMHTL